jgi:putative RNA 2'-phosphotransferase
LPLDRSGWADIEELITKAGRAGVKIDKETLSQVVEHNDKKRFSLNEEGAKIRASQGHSISVELGLIPITPPDKLFHGTAVRFLGSIKVKGLLPQRRHHVHFSEDEKTAVSVGRRHGKPIVLVIKSGQMAEDGYKFYRSANGVWLTDNVPVEYIEFPPE